MQNWKFIVDLLVVCVLTVSFGDEIDMKLVILFLIHDSETKVLILLGLQTNLVWFLLSLYMLDLRCRREAVPSKASRRSPKVRPLCHVYEIDYVVVLIFVHY